MILTRTQAETELSNSSIRTSSWHESAGFLFKIYQVSSDFDCRLLPDEFEVLWINDYGDSIVREMIDTIGDF